MTTQDVSRARALAWIIADDIASAMNVGPAELGQEWRDFAEATAMNVYATGRIERMASMGALAYHAARLP